MRVINVNRAPSWAKLLYDGNLPVDYVFAGSIGVTCRPGILSERAEQEEVETIIDEKE